MPCHESCYTFKEWLDDYCHKSLLNTTETLDEFAMSEEGELPPEESDLYELVHVHLVVRHGDRSAANPYTLGSPVAYHCGLVEGEDDVSWSGLRDFPGRVALDNGGESTVSCRLPLHPGHTRKPCGLGKLTREGFLQQRVLGQQMWSRYGSVLVQNLTDSLLAKRIYAQSTDISRTIRSAASFLLGFLPDRRELRSRVSIHVSPGIRLQAPPTGVKAVYKRCKEYQSFRTAELEKSGYFETEKSRYHPLLEQLSLMFYLGVGNRPIIIHIYDCLISRGCHANSDDIMPCHRGHCVDYDFANKLQEFADWTFSYGYTEAGSLVGLLPFMRQSVLALMEEVVKGKEEARQFALSLGHDNVLTQILLALGVRVDGLMSYASRIAFELWRAKGVVAEQSKDGFYVRILFNGVPITERLKAWETFIKDHSVLSSPLLPYSQWENFLVTGPFRDQQSFDKACGNE